MTREEARKAAEVMMAYADGKDIEFCPNGEDWDILRGDDSDQLSFDFSRVEYRIKKEPTYRPFKNAKECWAEMQKHQPFGWLSYDNKFTNILSVDDVSVALDLYGLDYVNALTILNFADGTPFGIKED